MKKYFAILILCIFLTVGCGGLEEVGVLDDLTADSPVMVEEDQGYWPTEAWQTSPAEEQGMDGELLDEMFAYIDEHSYLDMHSVLVIRNGYIVAERYYPPYTEHTTHVIYSCTKSVVSSLVGIAIEEGYIEDVAQPVLGFFPHEQYDNLDGGKNEMTLEDVLTMRTGLDWVEGMPAYIGLEGSPDALDYVLDMEMVAAPGERFNYCSGCTHILSAIIQETTGISTASYARERLFEPLGMGDVYWQTHQSGRSIGGWGIEFTPRQMAKFGYLFLNEGMWDGEQIVPVEWVEASTASGWEVDRWVDYGYQWWVYPEWDFYAAQGLHGQAIYVIPEHDLVVVFTADLDNTDIEFEFVVDWIIPAVGE